MKLLLVHDHVFSVTQDGAVYSHQFSYDVLKRYLNHFETVTVIGRKRAISNADNLNVASGAGVTFVLLDGIGFPFLPFGTRREVMRKVAAEVRACDIVIGRLPSELGLMAANIALRGRKVLAAEVVGCSFSGLWYHGSILGKIYAPLQYLRMRKILSSVHAALYVTNRYLQDRYPADRAALIASVSDVEIEEFSERRPGACRSADASVSSPLVVGIIGSMNSDYKGVSDAVLAVKLLRDVGVSVCLRVLGGGDASRFVALAEHYAVSGYVTFDGVRTSGAGVFRWLDEIDIYIQPSRTEGLPRSLIEAMSRGLPCIASSVGGIPELLASVYLHQPGDAAGLAARLRWIIQTEGQLESASVENLKAVRRYLPTALAAKRNSFFVALKSLHNECNLKD